MKRQRVAKVTLHQKARFPILPELMRSIESSSDSQRSLDECPEYFHRFLPPQAQKPKRQHVLQTAERRKVGTLKEATNLEPARSVKASRKSLASSILHSQRTTPELSTPDVFCRQRQSVPLSGVRMVLETQQEELERQLTLKHHSIIMLQD